MVEVKGIEKFAPKDFPGHISATFFTGGCNFRCPYCHNPELVMRPETLTAYPVPELIAFLEARRNWLDGICISGGEPLLHEDLDELLRLFKERRLMVKVDTNGSFPLHLKRLLDEELVDHIAMDIKAPLERYAEVTGVSADTEAVRNSIALIMQADIDYDFRTTVVPGLIKEEDIHAMGNLLQGSERWILQPFVPINTLDDAYLKKEPCSPDELKALAAAAESYAARVEVGGM